MPGSFTLSAKELRASWTLLLDLNKQVIKGDKLTTIWVGTVKFVRRSSYFKIFFKLIEFCHCFFSKYLQQELFGLLFFAFLVWTRNVSNIGSLLDEIGVVGH